MRITLKLLFLACLLGAAPAIATSTTPAPAFSPANPADWPFTTSDVPVDPAYRFITLPNGLKVIIRHNATPQGTALVRMEVHAGSLDEGEAERGFAHLVEHMAFQGSSKVPPGEMVRLLERNGLAFGADTNAFTSYEQTTYHLDLPKNDPALLDTALMLMRETASELRFDPAALTSERGVVLAEKRDRNGWQQKAMEDTIGFLYPNARYGQRLPIGTDAALNAATAASLRAFWERNYVPGKVTLVVIGDYPPDLVEALIRAHFVDWRAAKGTAQPSAGPVATTSDERNHIYLDQALSERVTISQTGAWQDEPDSQAVRQHQVLRRIGYGVINRRLDRIKRLADPPFRDAGFGTGDVFKAGRTTNLVVEAVDGQWRRGVMAAAAEWRRALDQGFTQAELDEQVAGIRTAVRHEVSGADTRNNGALMQSIFGLIRDARVPATPQWELEKFEAMIPTITPAAVLAAMNFEALPLNHPTIRWQGRQKPVGGEAALRTAWNEAMAAPLAAATATSAKPFAYTNFGKAGTIAEDGREPIYGIRTLRFANGVRLNIKPTTLAKDQVVVSVQIDGGEMLNTKAKPLAVAMASALPLGGLGQHSSDELQSLIAGHAISSNFGTTSETFSEIAQTTPDDLVLQLQLLAALITDPGYRPEGELTYRLNINNYFSSLNSTPAGVLGAKLGGILSDDDPRFSQQKVTDYRALTFAKLKSDLADRLAHGAIEIAVVGDIAEDQAIAAVAQTFGAVPKRERDFLPYADQRQRPFTADHSLRTLSHKGPKDQALLRLSWLTRDDKDPVAKQGLNLLQRVVQIALTETLRQKLGKAYSPNCFSDPSRVWKDYGIFGLTASLDVKDVAVARAAIAETLAALRDRPISDDMLLRARAPVVEGFDNALKSNGGWLGIVGRAQSQPDRVERQFKARDRLLALTSADVQAAARLYLTPAGGVEVDVVPEVADGK